MKNALHSFIFHQTSKSIQMDHKAVPLNPKDWPEEWHKVRYKSYPRLSRIYLVGSALEESEFKMNPLLRTSRRKFQKSTLTLRDISALVQYSCGINRGAQIDKTGKERIRSYRVQPSAGALYPIEMYILLRDTAEGIRPGLYHYNVKMHALELLNDKQFSDEEFAKIFVDTWETGAAAIIFLTAVFHRTQSKYGERGYRHVLLEAGHIGQNLYLVSDALGLGCCAIGGTRDEEIERLLDIDGVNESLVYTLVVGHIKQ